MDSRAVIETLAPFLLDGRAARLDAVAAARLAGLVVVLENLNDPHNGAAALRTIEAVGGLEVRVVGGPLRFSPVVTQGCHKWLRIETDASIQDCAAGLRARGYRIYAAVPGAPTALEELDPLEPAAFLLGNEHDGLTTTARALADREYALPLHGFSQSVNLSVATALTVYTHARRRRVALARPGDLDESALLDLRALYYRRDVKGAEAILARRKG